MLNEFKKYISDNNLIKSGDRVLMAVSGGIDSMVMSHLFLQTETELGIMHCNFSLRADESDKDEFLVKSFADEYDIPFFSRKFETKSYARSNGLSIQMAARELRYSWFEEVREENGYDLIAVAHNLNDNIETLIINLTRGTGIAGLTGMRPSNNKIIRPILFATREDITEYCNLNNIPFREDKSNKDTKYIRNKIRHLILPVLKEINPSIELTLNETAERFTGLNEIVNDYFTELKKRVLDYNDKSVAINISVLKEYIHNRTILYELFKPYGVTNVQITDLIKVIEGKTGGRIITESHRIIKNRKELIISDEDTQNDINYIIDDINDFARVPCIASAGYIQTDGKIVIPSDPFIAYLDSEKISFPMLIRKWKPGDHFYPLGMKQKKKLSDYFIDNKYSIIDKETILILELKGEIVWIIGSRIDNRFRITKSTKKALIIKSIKKALIIKPVN